ncbi:hypothetical protein LZ30DRAFT_694100 [Colletotrichum cereale]|nr:hypothetical protein LZ30DRAFT_694100 [Colletotrichum cereale]
MFPTRLVRDLQNRTCLMPVHAVGLALPHRDRPPREHLACPLSTTPSVCSTCPKSGYAVTAGIGQDANLAETPSDLPPLATRAAVTTEIETNLEPVPNAQSSKALLVGTSHFQLSSTRLLMASFVVSSFPQVSDDLKDRVIHGQADASSGKAPDERSQAYIFSDGPCAAQTYTITSSASGVIRNARGLGLDYLSIYWAPRHM